MAVRVISGTDKIFVLPFRATGGLGLLRNTNFTRSGNGAYSFYLPDMANNFARMCSPIMKI